jgi:hypothetical protein
MAGREPLATTAEVASYLNRTTRTLVRWRSDGIGPHWTRDAGGKIGYEWADVDEWRKTQPSGPATGEGTAA